MNSLVTKVKTNFAADSVRFEFKEAFVIPAKDGLELVITASGGVIAFVQATLCDVNDVVRAAIGVPDQGPPLDTADHGSVSWQFQAKGCSGGYLKWRCWVSRSGGDLAGYTITEEIRDQGKTLYTTTVRGTIPDGAVVDTPFLDGVQIRGDIP